MKKLELSLLMAEQKFSFERIAHLTFTFTRGTTDKEACAEFSAINRQFLRLFSGGYVRVLAFTEAGAPHLHVIAVADQDLRAGFDFDAYEKLRDLDDLRLLSHEQEREPDELGCSLTTNPELLTIWSRIDDLLRRRRSKKKHRHTFACRFDVCPVIKAIGALSHYIGDNLEDTVKRPSVSLLRGKSRWAWERGKLSRGVRAVSYGGSFPQAFVLLRTRGQIIWESKVDVILKGMPMPRDWMKDRFHHPKKYGRDGKVWPGCKLNWHHYIREIAIPELEKLYGSDSWNWPVKEAGRVGLQALAHIDQWAINGWPEEATRWLNAPSWCDLGFATYEDYLLSRFSSWPPTTSVPLPPVKKQRGRSAV